MENILEYSLRILPGLILISSVFIIMPKKQLSLRIFLLIFGFILIRDAMTPVGYWSFGLYEQAMWLRFIDDSYLLIVLGSLSIAISVLLLRQNDLRKLVRWGNPASPSSYIVGLAAGILVSSPFLLLSAPVDIHLRGGEVGLMLLPALLYMALAGNFLEELLFRGFLQSKLQKQTSPTRAALLSGLLFAVAHVFLASTVTNVGVLLLVFVAIEGIVCAFVYKRYGLISAAITHGIAIFMLASGIF